MNFYINGKYNPFEELMYYYKWGFYVYYFLMFIVFINSIKSLLNFFYFKRDNNISAYIDLFISFLCGLGLACGMLFQAILSDISSKYYKMWGNKMMILCILAFILFVIQVIFFIKKEKSN